MCTAFFFLKLINKNSLNGNKILFTLHKMVFFNCKFGISVQYNVSMDGFILANRLLSDVCHCFLNSSLVNRCKKSCNRCLL